MGALHQGVLLSARVVTQGGDGIQQLHSVSKGLTFKGTAQPRPAYRRDRARRLRAGSLLGQLRGHAEEIGLLTLAIFSFVPGCNKFRLAHRRPNSRFGSSAVSDLLGT
jgi:hypothetical protein